MHNRRPEDQVSISLNAIIGKQSKPAKDGLQSLSSLLPQRIQTLETTAKAVLALGDRVRQLLPEPEKNHVVSASYQENELVIRATSSAWCTRIRFHEGALREALVAQGEKLFTKLKVRVGRPEDCR